MCHTVTEVSQDICTWKEQDWLRVVTGPLPALSHDRQISQLPLWGPTSSPKKAALYNPGKIGHAEVLKILKTKQNSTLKRLPAQTKGHWKKEKSAQPPSWQSPDNAWVPPM